MEIDFSPAPLSPFSVMNLENFALKQNRIRFFLFIQNIFNILLDTLSA